MKLFILRCDDSEAYKSSARALVRDWIKTHAPQSQKKVSANNAENHDAFEWMILHVVIPDGQDDFVWPSKTSASVLEKVKSDFNTSAKPVHDRVAQVLSGGWHGGHRRAPESQRSSDEGDPFRQDSIRAWDDLISKMKTLILSSFDLRVRQYEEDIKQRVAQRSLPGWNFCTFFVLKEGLARGFESVGLLEDALVGYDELSVELISALRDEAGKRSAGESTSLVREYTKELVNYAEWASSAALETGDGQASASQLTPVLETDTTSFRERILANDVSAFEFRSYVFARQVRILLRMAASAEVEQAGAKSADSLWNPMTLAEICGRAGSFIASVSRTIRQDLSNAFAGGVEARISNSDPKLAVIDNVVASWVIVSVQQMLAATGRVFQSEDPSSLKSDHGSSASPRELQDRPLAFTANSSSPAEQKLRIAKILLEQSDCTTLTREDVGSSQVACARLANGIFASLLAQRARLFTLARRALSTLGRSLGWRTGWALKHRICGALEDVPLNDEPRQSVHQNVKASAERLLKSSSQPSFTPAEGTPVEDVFLHVYKVGAFFNLYCHCPLTCPGPYSRRLKKLLPGRT